MTKPIKMTPAEPNAVQIWGFYRPVTVHDVAKAVEIIAAKLTGEGYTIHIMSGTHGYCGEMAGAVARTEPVFADEDRRLAKPHTRDNHVVALCVHPFNNGDLGEAPDHVTAALAKLNTSIRAMNPDPKRDIFLLAYCCSAGTKPGSKA
jgi:hypothetical protein